MDVSWPGSPLNFSLPNIEGRIGMKAEKGRFVDLGEGSGAVRIFSLLNFAAIAKRMTLDFSDVFGKGISFDELTATVTADHGVINFVEPMAIDGTGGDFRINGTVNLLTGVLDNEMVVGAAMLMLAIMTGSIARVTSRSRKTAQIDDLNSSRHHCEIHEPPKPLTTNVIAPASSKCLRAPNGRPTRLAVSSSAAHPMAKASKR